MATRKTTTAGAPGSGVAIDANGFLVGDRESLEADPSCPAGMFDGLGVTWKTSRTIALPDGRRANVLLIGRRFRLSVWSPYEASAANHGGQPDVAPDIAEAQRQLNRLPSSMAAYRDEALGLIEFVAKSARLTAQGRLGRYNCGYALAPEARDAVDRALWALQEAFEDGRVVEDASRRQIAADKILQPLRNANPALTRLLLGLRQQPEA
jgi:hypothetical protein